MKQQIDRVSILVATASFGGVVLSTQLWSAATAQAAPDAASVCTAVARQAKSTLWSHLRSAGDDLFCRKAWLPGRVDEMAACAVWTLSDTYAHKVQNLWNGFFQRAGGEWATWGPRGIGPDWEEGTIVAGYKRTFFGAGLAYSKSTLEIVKEGGAAEATVTLCVLDQDGHVVSDERRHFPGGVGGEGRSVKMVIDNATTHVLGLVVDTPPSLQAFEYRARLSSEPIRNDLGDIRGIADLHVHQVANLAFGGRVLWGQHDGPAARALAPELVEPLGAGLDASSPQQLLARLFESGGIDANLLLSIVSPEISDEGFFRYGGAGHPSFDAWPHHADRSHQQTHIDWVKEAHERGRKGERLRLLVVSLVNNDVLCSVAKAFDRVGNVPRHDSEGNISGWESAGWACSDHENVLRQFEALHQLERAYPWYRIAMSPWHARQIMADGHLAVVVSMETDKPLSAEGNSAGNWEHQLDAYRALGLSTLQVVHESDSQFCGAAPHRAMMQALQLLHWPIQSLENLVHGSTFDLDEQGRNTLGLTPAGERLVDAMVKRNMPIDLAHGSQRCRREIMKRVGRDYGLYDSHTKFERLLEPEAQRRQGELLITESILPAYLEHKVLVGLRTSATDVKDAPGGAGTNDCPGSAKSFAQALRYAHQRGLDVAYGSDFNTGSSQLGPRFGSKRCWAALPQVTNRTSRPVGEPGDMPDRARWIQPIARTNYYTDGLTTIGWLPELTIDLASMQTPGVERLRTSAQAFLTMWKRAYPLEGSAPLPRPEPGSVALGGACRAGDECHSGACSGVAGLPGVCVCNEDADCSSGHFCNAGIDLVRNRCEPKRGDDDACPLAGGDRACRSGQCKLGRCYTPRSVAMGGICHVDEACERGQCSSIDGLEGRCECSEDEQCGSGYWCDAGLDTHRNACRRKLDDGEICGWVGELGVGRRCKSGRCTLVGISTKLECN